MEVPRRLWPWIFVCLLPAWGITPADADTVTLNSGEVLEGRILSETDTRLVIEASLYHGTILSTREVARSDIRSVVRESVEQQREKADFDALAKYTLNPDQELTKDQYAAGIAAFEKFLTTHTNSGFAADVNQRLVDWQAEASNVESGRVKFAGTWMTPDEKKAQVERRQRQAAQDALLALQKQLVDLRVQRVVQAQKIVAIQKQLADAQSRLASLPGAAGPAAGSGGRRDLAGRLTAGVVGASQGEGAEEPASDPERSQVQDQINTLQQQISQGQRTLASLDAKIADIQSQIPTPSSTHPRASNAPATTAQPSAPASEPIPPW
jgi:hypothetical protein